MYSSLPLNLKLPSTAFLTKSEGKLVRYLCFYIMGFRVGVHSRASARRPAADNTGAADFMLIDLQRQSTTQQPTSPDGLPRLDGVI